MSTGSQTRNDIMGAQFENVGHPSNKSGHPSLPSCTKIWISWVSKGRLTPKLLVVLRQIRSSQTTGLPGVWDPVSSAVLNTITNTIHAIGIFLVPGDLQTT